MNNFEETLRDVVPESDRLSTARELAVGALGLGGSISAPIDLRRIAERLGVTRLSAVRLPCDGLLIPTSGGGYEILVSKDKDIRRQRFSIAHEIGHILLQKMLPGLKEPRIEARSGEVVADSEYEERLCDMIAAQILMPDEIVNPLAGHDVSISLLQQLSDRWKVSLSATSYRLKEAFSDTDFAVAWFKGSGNGCRMTSVLVNFSSRRLHPCSRHLYRVKSAPCIALSSRGVASSQEWVVERCGTRKRLLDVEAKPAFRSTGRSLALLTNGVQKLGMSSN